MPDEPLAAVIDRERAEEAIDALRSEGIYDPSRRIEPVDGGRLAIPVTETTEAAPVEGFEGGRATERRLRTLEDHLRSRGWGDGDLEQAPSSYARIGRLVVVDGTVTHRPAGVGEALLALHGDCTGAFAIEHIDGPHRTPQLVHLAGDPTTATVHREHGVEYTLDLSEVMFSPGNQHERRRMGEVVAPGETVVDLCAGIGYFAIPMAVAGAAVTAIERNPTAFRWLTRNATRNGVDHRCTPVLGDCRGCSVSADRAVIGHLPVHDCRDDPTEVGGGYLDAALRAVDDGWLHVHGIAWADEHTEAGRALGRRLRRRGAAVDTLAVHRVKGVAPRTDHIVVDVRIHLD